MPFGEYPYSIDDKGRVVMPQGFRDFVEDGMVLTRGLEGCLYLFPSSTWKRIEEELVKLPLADPAGRQFVRFFYSGASKVRLDAQGRISVPTTLRQFAALDNEVIVAGAPNRLELWDEARWLNEINHIQANPPMQELLPDILQRLIG
jgi:MraZ protein